MEWKYRQIRGLKLSILLRGSNASEHEVVYEKISAKSIRTGALGVIKVDISHFWRVLKHLNVTCKASTASIVGKEWFENVSGIQVVYEKISAKIIRTGALGVIKVDISHFWRVLKHLNVTCKASTASIVGKEWFENVSGIQVVYEKMSVESILTGALGG